MQELAQQQCNHRDVEDVFCECGQRMNVKDWRTKTLYTRHGTITLRRRYLICKECGSTRRPLDEALRIPGRFSPEVIECMALVGVTESSRTARMKLAKLAGLHVSHKTILKHTEQIGAELIERQVSQAPSEPLPPEAPQAYVSMDGVKVNTLGGWREMKLGCVYDYGLIWRNYIASLETADDFGARLRTVATLSGIGRVRELVAVADGAHWIWNQIKTRLPSTDVEIVDFYHATEQLGGASRHFYGEGTPAAKRWLKKYRHVLYHQGVEALIKKLRNTQLYRRKDHEMHRLVGYFVHHRNRMDYPRLRRRGYDIGSGLIESGCKNVVQERLKGSGMRWREDSACAVATLRSALLSDRWEEFFENRLAA
jgi:hypothetical protein